MQTNLIILQKKNKDTNKKMAKLLGISSQQYSKKLSGKTPFNQDEMFSISNYYKVSVNEIFLPRKATNSCKDK